MDRQSHKIWTQANKYCLGIRKHKVLFSNCLTNYDITSIFSLKCTLVQALRLCTGRTAHRGVEVKLYSFMTTAREGGERSASRPGRSLPPVPILQEAGWAPGPFWRGAENIAPTGIRSPDRPARSQTLHRLSYPTRQRSVTLQFFCLILKTLVTD